MKIKELEQRLGIDRANIRFYEKEGLVSPARTENGYRDYSEEDEQKLKTIVLLRKLGVSVAGVKNLLEGRKELGASIEERTTELKKEIESLKGAIEICNTMKIEKAEMEDLNTDSYWQLMKNREASGLRFGTLINDVVEQYKDFAGFAMAIKMLPDSTRRNPLKLGLYIAVFSLFIGFIHWLPYRTLESLIDGMITPFIVVASASLFMLPYKIIGRRNAKAAGIYKQVIGWLALGLLVAVVLLTVVVLLNAKYHFIF